MSKSPDRASSSSERGKTLSTASIAQASSGFSGDRKFGNSSLSARASSGVSGAKGIPAASPASASSAPSPPDEVGEVLDLDRSVAAQQSRESLCRADERAGVGERDARPGRRASDLQAD